MTNKANPLSSFDLDSLRAEIARRTPAEDVSPLMFHSLEDLLEEMRIRSEARSDMTFIFAVNKGLEGLELRDYKKSSNQTLSNIYGNLHTGLGLAVCLVELAKDFLRQSSEDIADDEDEEEV